MTDGGPARTNGGERRAWLVAWLAFAAIGTAYVLVNATSEIDERARLGVPVREWEPWVWELTSLAGWLMLAPAVFLLSARLQSAGVRWPIALAVHLAGSAAASIAHVAIMVGLRHGLYAAVGDTYGGGGPLRDILLYEYRKDLITYGALALLLPLVRHVLRRSKATTSQNEACLEVRDGSRTWWIRPADLEWAQAAGNYVELHGLFGTLLHRQTLAALAEDLEPHGFKRVHRSRLVRAGAIRSVEVRPSGDFEIMLASGTLLTGSRRFRGALGLAGLNISVRQQDPAP